jgi:hypothetical protein
MNAMIGIRGAALPSVGNSLRGAALGFSSGDHEYDGVQGFWTHRPSSLSRVLLEKAESLMAE